MTDEIEAIRARHIQEEKGDLWALEEEFASGRPDAHTDRATLLSRVDALAAELAAEQERGERMREALASFVDRTWMKCLSNDLSPNHLISMDVRVSDLRRARAALEGGS